MVSSGKSGSTGDSAGFHLSWILSVLILAPFTFSTEIVEAVYEALRVEQPWWALAVADSALLTVSLVPTIFLWRRHVKPGISPIVYWTLGALGSVGIDSLVFVTKELSSAPLDLLFTLLYTMSLAALLCGIAGFNPFRSRHLARYRFRATLPFLGGTVFAYIASIFWDYELDPSATRSVVQAVDELRMRRVSELGYIGDPIPNPLSPELYQLVSTACSGAVNQEFFAQAAQILPLLLIALAFEARFIERLRSDPIARSMGVVTVLFIFAGELLVVSALPKSNEGCGNVLTAWHEYAAFIVTIEAVVVALLYLLWAAFGARPEAGPPPRADSPDRPRSLPSAARAPTSDGVIAAVLAVGIGMILALLRRARNTR